MRYQPVVKTRPDTALLPDEARPILYVNLSSGRYSLIYTPLVTLPSWLTSTGNNGITFTLNVPLDRLYPLTPSFPFLSAFLTKMQKGVACKLTDHPCTADLRMIRTVRNLLDCSYTGYRKDIYFDLQITDLLIMALAGVSGQDTRRGKGMALKPLDVEKVEATRRYLMENMDHPPTLVRLARMMGLNDYKLKKAYRQLYGTTLFEDFLHARMARAKQLLEDGDNSIVGIADLVGYKNVSSFSVAFKKYFGCTPGERRKRYCAK